jgi:DNA repair protein RecN (Recombination protein N)
MDSISADPLRLTEIEDRLDLINSLLHKHKVKSVEDLQQLISHREREILVAQDFDKAIDTTRKKLENGELELTDKANELSAVRNDAAAKLSQELQTSIRKLAMQDARFEIRIDKNHKAVNLKSDALSALSILSETGQDTVEYLFSANPGSDLKSLSAVASGGEMSRILLGIKEVLVNKESARLLVLDEIDSGIGGKTADNVATCIAGIAQRHPVLCITHLAQIAAVADTHIAVNKDADSKTSVTLRVLSPAQRIPEIARMLSGDASSLALKHAEELINKH